MARPFPASTFPLRRLGGSYVHCDLPVRLHACSPPRLAATQLARSAVLNRLIAPTGTFTRVDARFAGAPIIRTDPYGHHSGGRDRLKLSNKRIDKRRSGVGKSRH